jgi:lysyl-tRNA synthetase class 2
MPAVDSSAILAVEHDARAERLAIRFVSGETYVYDGVPRAVYDAFLAAPSKGTFFQAEIRDHYPFARI